GIKITLSKQISKELLYPIKLIFILLCADWSAWEFQEGILGASTWGTPSTGELLAKAASNEVKRVIAPKDNFIGKELTPSKIACQFLIEGGEKLIPSLRL
ncbi:MAG: hypothetical protein ABSH06_15355, partial [Thermodesulfobacteriota bacterium]